MLLDPNATSGKHQACVAPTLMQQAVVRVLEAAQDCAIAIVCSAAASQ